MNKVTVIYKKGGKRVTMAKRYAEVLVKQKVAEYATTEAVSADGETYKTRQMERRTKGRGKAAASQPEPLAIGKVYDVYGDICLYADFTDDVDGKDYVGMIKIRDLPEEVVSDLVEEGLVTQEQSDAVGGGMKRLLKTVEAVVEPESIAVEGTPAPELEGASVDGGANTADDAKNGASNEKDGKVQANTGEAAE